MKRKLTLAATNSLIIMSMLCLGKPIAATPPEMMILKEIMKPLYAIDSMNVSYGIYLIKSIFKQIEDIIEVVLKYFFDYQIIEMCHLYLIHSFVTPTFFNIIKIAIKTIIFPYLENYHLRRPQATDRFMIGNYINLYFKAMPGTFMKNMARKSNNPFSNALHDTLKNSIVNVKFPKICNEAIVRKSVDFGALILVISDTQIGTNETLLRTSENVSHLHVQPVANDINQYIKAYVLSNMVNNMTITDMTDFLKVCDFILLEMYRLLTSPSILWTSGFSKYFHSLFYSVTLLVSYGYLMLCIFGMICNLIAILFCASTLKLSSLNIYLLTLAFLDSLALLGNLLPISMKFWLHFLKTMDCSKTFCIMPSHFADIYEISDSGCKLANFSVSFCRAASAWLMVSTAFVRLMAVSRPFQWRHKTMRFNIKVIIVTVLSTAILTFFLVLTRKLTVYHIGHHEIRYCHQNDYGIIAYGIEIYLRAMIFPILPMVSLLVFNACTIYVLRRNNASTKVPLFCGGTAASGMRSKVSENKSTVTLLIVSFTFIFFTSPYFVNALVQLYSKYDFRAARSAVNFGTGPLLNLETYFNTFFLSFSNAINLFLYLLSSKPWRRKALDNLKQCASLKSKVRLTVEQVSYLCIATTWNIIALMLLLTYVQTFYSDLTLGAGDFCIFVVVVQQLVISTVVDSVGHLLRHSSAVQVFALDSGSFQLLSSVFFNSMVIEFNSRIMKNVAKWVKHYYL